MENKGNDGKGNTPERDLWQTKQTFWEKLDNQYLFDFDCCANCVNTKCENWSDNFESCKELKDNICWMNPPFSKAKDMFKHFFKVVEKGVAIYRCDNMETKIWQDIILKNATWILIPKGRISYTPFDIEIRKGMGSRFPSALIGFNVGFPKEEGIILIPKRPSGSLE